MALSQLGVERPPMGPCASMLNSQLVVLLEVVESFARDLIGRHSSMEAEFTVLAWFCPVSLSADP